jgi:hypothetical protein
MPHPPHPDPSTAAISRASCTDVELPPDISEVELVQYRLERELRDARDRIRALEGGCWRRMPATATAARTGIGVVFISY